MIRKSGYRGARLDLLYGEGKDGGARKKRALDLTSDAGLLPLSIVQTVVLCQSM